MEIIFSECAGSAFFKTLSSVDYIFGNVCCLTGNHTNCSFTSTILKPYLNNQVEHLFVIHVTRK